MTELERLEIVLYLSENPDAGDLIVGTGGARKVRFPFRGKGKSGGVRVITFFAGADIPVFLLDVFSKGDRVDLSQSDRNQLSKILGNLAASYRKAKRI